MTENPYAMTTDSTIFLIGYMGCGKTTLGRALAKCLNRDFYDLDFYIEQRFRKSVSEIFAEKGEEGFREIERKMLREVGEMEKVIVACGGGTPCFFDNMDFMNSHGVTIWLRTSEEVLFRRLTVRRARRPLLARLDDDGMRRFIAESLAVRVPHYSRAHITFDADLLEDRRQISASLALLLPCLNASIR